LQDRVAEIYDIDRDWEMKVSLSVKYGDKLRVSKTLVAISFVARLAYILRQETSNVVPLVKYLSIVK